MRETDFVVVRENLLNMIKYSKQEYNTYKQTKNIVYLQQAGEKLFNALENYISFINKTRVEYFQQLRTMIKEKSLVKLLYDARDLHRFFYHGTNEMIEQDANIIYQSVLNRIENRIKNI